MEIAIDSIEVGSVICTPVKTEIGTSSQKGIVARDAWGRTTILSNSRKHGRVAEESPEDFASEAGWLAMKASHQPLEFDHRRRLSGNC